MIRLPSTWAGRLLALASIFAFFLSSFIPRLTVKAQQATSHSVTWDSHSVLVDGRRVLLFGGEFHYWRLPSPQMWTDRLEKMKAAGLNTVSIYFDWQYHSERPGQYDFTGVRDVEKLLQITDRLGIYVLARVGPYMNAEADAGGLPGWLLTQPLYPRAQSWNGTVAQGQYSPLYAEYSREWYDHILPIVSRHQVTKGGSVLMLQVENEYSQSEGSQQYMQDLYDRAKSDGIAVPIFHNDFWFKGDWSKLVDLYAYDSYPYGFGCCHQWWDTHFHGIDTWESSLRSTLNITTPMFVSELQGGSFDPWGGQGYDKVAATLDGDWLTAIDESALAQGTSVLNTYMFVGGTSWGYMSEPDVYTSYDYGAPVSESGSLRPAYYAAHRLGMFLQSYGPTLAAADATPNVVSSSNSNIVVHARTNTSTGEEFLFLRHGDAGNPEATHLRITAGSTSWTIPQRKNSAITLPGHGSALLMANLQTGPLHMNYSTSQILTETNTATGPYLVLHGAQGTDGEIDFALPDSAVSVKHNAGVTVTRDSRELRLNYTHTAEPRMVRIQTPDGTLRLLITSSDAASRYWVTNGMIISGPDLVTDTNGKLKLSSTTGRDTRVYGAPANRNLLIDGQTAAAPDDMMGATLLGTSRGPAALSLPSLTDWKFAPGSPEIDPAFDDAAWQSANHTGTSNPNVPPTSTLLADDYGFHYGYVWYRGHFVATGKESGISITARHSFSVYLNGTYIGSGDAPLDGPPHTYANLKILGFPASAIRIGQDNVISVLTESLGHDEGWVAGPAAQSPQGILAATINDTATPIVWKIQGNSGGEKVADTERGLLNASGLYGERSGWYLPGFDDSRWSSAVVPHNWKTHGLNVAVGWYRTHFRLNLADGDSRPIGLTLPHVSDKAVVWVNGWLLGRYWEERGPQHTFYIPDGILRPRGDNVVSIAVWNRGHDGGLISSPSLSAYPASQSHILSLGASIPATPTGYWHTSGNRIVDDAGHPIRIAAANWFGMENRFFVPSGLDKQALTSILNRVRDLGFNAIRLPFSNQAIEDNPVVTNHLDANPDLQGLRVLDIMDKIVAAAGHVGLRIILDNGRSGSGSQPETNGLWYTTKYPESAWIHDWDTLVTRYKGNPTVVGVDLRNEPHTGPPGPWSVKTYLTQGSTWGAYKGIEREATDWRLAAERGGNAVLAVNPHLLILVEGIQQYPDLSWENGIESYWWGGILYPARQYPVRLAVAHRLVYSPHEYGPIKWQMPFFGPKMTYESMKNVWEKHWGFLEKPSFPGQAPIVIGEFGTCGLLKSCVDDVTPGSQGLWFKFLMQYLKKHPEIGWSYWALNGTNHVGHTQPNYVLADDWRGIRTSALVQTLRDIEMPPPPSH